ncbi:hypothetical protein EXIGLDRAFT_758101 [Exidia glandulosa HHB12029]|uniref:Uncharacterized protein n=1 Tax=Exidia glandulosa HHB12029 TaxID=1314781 RepID=A0A165QL93_EXIGL|nr:hypothetical protein EXIGLDRAFT_758101 [Exidia glandulosa HHB12029]
MPRTPSKSSTRRRVLRELPLEQFVPADALVSPAAAGKKRPHPSPGGLLSPHKRRILDVEGMLSPSKKIHASPARRRVDLAGPSSPARKLDFASMAPPPAPSPAKKTVLDASDNPFAPPSPDRTPTAQRTAPKLVPSPELETATRTKSATRGLATPPPSQESLESYYASYEYEASVHYPGFTIALDNGLTSYPTPATSAASSQDSEAETEIGDDKENAHADDCKENRPPRRKIKKAATDPAGVKPLRPRVSSPVASSSALLSPRARSPRASLPADTCPSINAVLFAKPLAPLPLASPSVAERKRRRMALECEADEETAIDDSL